MKTPSDFNIFSLYVATVSPAVESLIEKIGKDYDLPIEEMKERYLYNDRKAFDKMIKNINQRKPEKSTLITFSYPIKVLFKCY